MLSGIVRAAALVTLLLMVTAILPAPAVTPNAVALPGAAIVSGHKGVDSCDSHTTSQMQTWWDSSPYWMYGFYLNNTTAPDNSHCFHPGASWLSTVIVTQGWRVAPIYLGRQNPCSGFTDRISTTTSTAHSQGIAAADDTYNQMTDDGFPLSSGIAYFDMEPTTYTTTSTCRSAMKSFVRGWDTELHGFGYKAGYYGNDCGSFFGDMAAISPAPDDIWFSWYNGDSSVWNANCVPSTDWASNQRIKQYAEHDTATNGGETWGGVTMNVDDNCVDARVDGYSATGGTQC